MSYKILSGLLLSLCCLLPGCRGRSPLPTDTACPGLYMPVCGRDGKTYQNSCEARKAGQTSTTTGECPGASLLSLPGPQTGQ